MKPHNPSRSTQQPLKWLLGFLLIAITALVFAPVLHHDFVAWDDDLHIYDNPRMRSVSWTHIQTFWHAPYARLYMPLTYTLWAGLVWLTRCLHPESLTAELFHRLNLLLHVGSVLLVYRLGILVLGRSAEATQRIAVAACAGAVLFGLHPLQVEAVAWVSGLKDVLCGWWTLVAVWLYVEHARRPHGRCRWLLYGLATVAYGLALLSKPTAVIVPIMAGLLATRGLGQPWGGAARALAGWLGVALLWGCLTKGQQPDAVMEFVTPWWERPVVAADAIAFYLGKLLWPVNLGPLYGRTPQQVLAQGWGYVTALVPLALGLSLVWRRHRLGGACLAAGVFIVGLLPVLGFVPFLFQGHSTVADRYVYLAMLGPALGLGRLLSQASRPRVVWLGVGLLLGLMATRSSHQLSVWQNTVTLFTHTLRVNPQSAIAYSKLGTALARQGRLDDALAHYTTAIQLRPTYASAHNNLGAVFFQQGRFGAAMTHYITALQLEPDGVAVHSNLAQLLRAQGKLDDAISHYTAVLRGDPYNVAAHVNVGSALAAQGQLDAAIAHYRTAIRLNPQTVEAHQNLGNALLGQGKREAAIHHYQEALRVNPNWAEGFNNLGNILDDQGQSAEAVTYYLKALHLKPDLADAYNNLGNALLAQGDARGAVTAFQQAVTLQPGWAMASYNLGVALMQLGQVEAAQTAYRTALRWQSGWPEATLPLVWLLVQEAHMSPAALREAAELAEAACQAACTNATALYALALVRQAQGDRAQAQSLAIRALEQAQAGGHVALTTQIARQFTGPVPEKIRQ